MDASEAVALLSGAVPRRAGTWADLGAGDGTFTRALTWLLGPGRRIYAVDRDLSALATLERAAGQDAVTVIPGAADFTRPFDLPGLAETRLDGTASPAQAQRFRLVRNRQGVLTQADASNITAPTQFVASRLETYAYRRFGRRWRGVTLLSCRAPACPN